MYTRIKTTILLFFLVVPLGIFQSNAQQCDAVPFMKKGTLLEYTNYNKKGKADSKVIHETLSISGGDNTYDAAIKATVKDIKNKETFNTEYKASCKDGLFSVDMIRFFNFDKLAEQNKTGLSLQIDGNVLEFPSGMKAGDVLNDGTISVKVNSDALTLVTMTFKVFNRKIVGEEKITTPAGTFNCKKVSFDFDSKFGFISIKGTGIEWYYNDAVVVRSESYNKKGKLIGYSELTGMP